MGAGNAYALFRRLPLAEPGLIISLLAAATIGPGGAHLADVETLSSWPLVLVAIGAGLVGCLLAGWVVVRRRNRSSAPGRFVPPTP